MRVDDIPSRQRTGQQPLDHQWLTHTPTRVLVALTLTMVSVGSLAALSAGALYPAALSVGALAAGANEQAQALPVRDRIAANARAIQANGIIRGHIFSADTRQPLRRARVSLAGTALESPLLIDTDDGGAYEFLHLAASQYRIAASKSGYLHIAYGQRTIAGTGRTIDLRDGAVLDSIDIALPRMSIISGRIFDESGDPLNKVTVSAMQVRYTDEGREFVRAAFAETDASGTFRLLGLSPGRYWVGANTNQMWTLGSGAEERTLSYVPTYYPASLKVEEGRSIDVKMGQEVTSVDFALVPGRPASISGRIFDSAGSPLAGKSVYLSEGLTSSGNGETAAKLNLVSSAVVAADGSFQIAKVPAGDYLLQARTNDRTPPEMASLSVSVVNADVDGLLLTTSAGGRIRGTVRTESNAIPRFAPSRMKVTARALVHRLTPLSPDPDNGRVKEDWTFAITGLIGRRLIRPQLPDGWQLKAVYLDGRDVTDRALEVKSGDELLVDVVITNKVTSVSGEVVTDAAAPTLQDYTVIAFAEDDGLWSAASRFVTAARPDQHGRFTISGLPAARYLIVAVSDVEQNQWKDPQYLEQLRRIAQPLRLNEGDRAQLVLKLHSPG